MNFLLTSPEGFVGIAANTTALMIFLSIILATVRLIRGPFKLSDRVVALDLISILLVAFLVVFAFASSVQAYLDAALALALVGFLGTVAFARLINQEGDIEDDA